MTAKDKANLQHTVSISFAFILLILFCATELDTKVAIFLDQQPLKTYQAWALQLTDIGKSEAWMLMSVLGALGLTAFLRIHNSFKKILVNIPLILRWRNWCSQVFLSMIVSGFFLLLTKFIVGRQRPYLSPNRDSLIFHPFNQDWDFQSFPSGHSQTLFCLAMMLSLRWPKWRLILTGIVGVLAFTRVMTLNHFLSDVIAGSAFGWWGAKLSYKLFKRRFPF